MWHEVEDGRRQVCVCGVNRVCKTWYGDVKKRDNMRDGEGKVNE